jgi:recombination associated protein RdgC
MQFKNLTLLHTTGLNLQQLEKLEAQLATKQFTPCASSEIRSEGFSKLAVNDQFSYLADCRALINYTIETKTVPASALKEALTQRCKEVAEQQGFYPGRKAQKQLREEVMDALLANALPSRKVIPVTFNYSMQAILIDTASPSVSDAIVSALLRATEIKFGYLRTEQDVSAEMTARLVEEDSGNLLSFVLNDAAETESRDEKATVVRYKNLNLETDEVTKALENGTRRVTKLALQWGGLVSFTLTEDLQLKGIKYLDTFKNEIKSETPEDFGSTFYLYMRKIEEMLAALVSDLDGVKEVKLN